MEKTTKYNEQYCSTDIIVPKGKFCSRSVWCPKYDDYNKTCKNIVVKPGLFKKYGVVDAAHRTSYCKSGERSDAHFSYTDCNYW